MRTLRTLKLVLCLTLLVPLSLLGKESNTIKDSKTVTKTFEVNKDAEFFLVSREADVTISTWDKKEVEVVVKLDVEAFDQEELDKMLQAMHVDIIGSPEKVSVKSAMRIKSQVTTGNRTRIKMEDQTIRIKKYRFTYDIKLPATNHIDVKNNYGKVVLGNHQGRVNLKIYEGDLQGTGISSPKGMVTLRYSDADLGNIKDLEVHSYESTIKLGESTSMSLNAKYTTLNTPRTRDVNLSAYESKINLGITGTVVGSHSYGSLIIAEAKRIELKTYELKMEAGMVDQLILTDSKYSNITCGKVNALKFERAYENRMFIGELNEVSGGSKYSRLDVGLLKKGLQTTGYEFICKVSELSKDFEELSFEGKYSKAEIHVNQGTKFNLQAQLTYGDLRFPREDFELSKDVKNGTNTVLNGNSKGYKGDASMHFKGHETNVVLTYR